MRVALLISAPVRTLPFQRDIEDTCRQSRVFVRKFPWQAADRAVTVDDYRARTKTAAQVVENIQLRHAKCRRDSADRNRGNTQY